MSMYICVYASMLFCVIRFAFFIWSISKGLRDLLSKFYDCGGFESWLFWFRSRNLSVTENIQCIKSRRREIVKGTECALKNVYDVGLEVWQLSHHKAMCSSKYMLLKGGCLCQIFNLLGLSFLLHSLYRTFLLHWLNQIKMWLIKVEYLI